MTPDEQRLAYGNGLMQGVYDAEAGVQQGKALSPWAKDNALWLKGYRDGRRWYLRRVASLKVVGEVDE